MGVATFLYNFLYKNGWWAAAVCCPLIYGKRFKLDNLFGINKKHRMLTALRKKISKAYLILFKPVFPKFIEPLNSAFKNNVY